MTRQQVGPAPPGPGPQDDATARSHRFRRARALTILAAAAFASASTTRVTDSLLPQLAAEYQVPVGAAAQVAMLYAFAYGLFQVFFGPLGDRFGKFRIILFACVGSAATTLACAFAGSLESLALARLASGVMAAAIIPLAMAWIGDVVPLAERQPVLARFLSGQVLGLLAGQIGGGVLGELFGWRSVFFAVGGFYLLVVAGLAYELAVNPATRPAAHTGARFGWRSWGIFPRLLRRPPVRFVLLAVGLEGFAMYGAFTYVGAELHLRFDFDFATVGLYLAAFAAGGLAYISQVARLVRLLGQPRLAFLGTLLLAAGYGLLAAASVAWLALPAIFLIGLGLYMTHNTLQTLATQMAPDARGSAVTLFATCFFVSQAAGVALAGLAVDRLGGSFVFLAAAVLLLALGLTLRLQLERRTARPEPHR